MLASIRPCPKVAVVALIVGFFPPQATRTGDFKSTMLLTDPSLGAPLRCNLFLPSEADHPSTGSMRLGDLFCGTDLRAVLYQDRVELTLSHGYGSTYCLLDGAYPSEADSCVPADVRGASLAQLRAWRLAQLALPPLEGRDCSSAFVPRAFPRNHVALTLAPTPPLSALPWSHPPSLAARQEAVRQRKTLALLEAPVGGRGYVCDLAPVRVERVADPFGSRSKLNLTLIDGAASVVATCWDTPKCQQLLGAQAPFYLMLDAVRVAASKVNVGALEVHINDNSTMRFVGAPPGAVAPAAAAADSSASSSASSSSSSSSTSSASSSSSAQRPNWKCSGCDLVNFPSRRACHRCKKPFDAKADVALDAPLVVDEQQQQQLGRKRSAPNAPPPLEAAAVVVKQARVELTEVITVDLTSAGLVLNPASGISEPCVTKLVDVMASKVRNGKWIVEARVVSVLPRDTRHCTRPFCPQCANPVSLEELEEQEAGGIDARPHVDPSLACTTCGMELKRSQLQFRYFVQLEVRQGSVTLPVLVCGEQADLFFRGIPATDLWRNHSCHQMLSAKLDRLATLNQSTPMALLSYVPRNRAQRFYQLFNTVLL